MIEFYSKNNQITHRKCALVLPCFLILFLILISFSACTTSSKSVIISKAVKSVVLLNIYDRNDETIRIGSGFAAFEDDVIVTNFHVIHGANRILITDNSGQEYEVVGVLGYDRSKDVAILQTEKNFIAPFVKFETLKTPQVGDDIIAIGSPLGSKQ